MPRLTCRLGCTGDSSGVWGWGQKTSQALRKSWFHEPPHTGLVNAGFVFHSCAAESGFGKETATLKLHSSLSRWVRGVSSVFILLSELTKTPCSKNKYLLFSNPNHSFLQINFLTFLFPVPPKGKAPHATFANYSHTHNNKLTSPLIISFVEGVTKLSWDKFAAVEEGSGEWLKCSVGSWFKRPMAALTAGMCRNFGLPKVIQDLLDPLGLHSYW